VRTTSRAGRYLRVASPDWDDPLDGSYAAAKGGRWNPPGSYGTVYLNRTQTVARLNVDRLHVGLPYGPEDLDPNQAPILVATDVPEHDYLDVVTDAGIAAAGLRATPTMPRESA
jgi:RES domain-containing protein